MIASSLKAEHNKGLLLTFIGGMVITFDTPVLRLIDGPQWTVMFWRASLLCLSVLVWWLVMHALKKSPPPLMNGKAGLSIILLYAIGNITFITAVFNTTIANVVFILALTPLFAAVISFIWLKERLRIETWLALVMSLLGVSIIVWSGLNSGSTFGDLMAAATALTMATAFTVTRRTGKDMSMSPVMVGAITAAIAFFASDVFVPESFILGPLAVSTLLNGSYNFNVLSLESHQWGWMLLNGAIIMPLSYSLLALGPRYITAAEVALFLLLETALAPFWVWLVVGEKVPFATIIGGTIILVTLMAHSFYKLRLRGR